MMKKNINQKIISLIEYYKMANIDIIINKLPIPRFRNNSNIDSISDKNKKLNYIKQKIKEIKNCNLKKDNENLIFSDGNINSKIMLVGDAPEEEDNKTGLPFSGSIGTLLNKMLEAINLNRENVYITNAINYSISEKRKPTNEEINKYLPYLKLHIEVINPKILILLGSVALEALFDNTKSISKDRGKWMKNKIGSSEPDIITTFHPNLLIKKPELKKNSWDDLKLIRNKIKTFKLL